MVMCYRELRKKNMEQKPKVSMLVVSTLSIFSLNFAIEYGWTIDCTVTACFFEINDEGGVERSKSGWKNEGRNWFLGVDNLGKIEGPSIQKKKFWKGNIVPSEKCH